MSLTDQDREWVRAIVQEAVLQTLNQAREMTSRAVERHQSACTFILKSRAMLLGIAIGAGAAGSGLTVAVQHFIP